MLGQTCQASFAGCRVALATLECPAAPGGSPTSPRCVLRCATLQSGKLLKVWGRFQEWVLHDPHRAARSYAEAVKRGLGDNMLNLTSRCCPA